MTTQFKNRREAEQAIADMEARAAKCDRVISINGLTSETAHGRVYIDRAYEYRAESVRITALLPTLPE